jgi:E1A/CREB-binding protein
VRLSLKLVDSSHPIGIQSSQQMLESNGQACSLCGTQRRVFEANVLYCRGKCPTQRIGWEATYYADRHKQNHWCETCYEMLPSTDAISLDDGTEIQKSELQVSKNDALPEEPWVQCDNCHSWVHQVCALFNGRTNKSSASYMCPNCHVKRNDSDLIPPIARKYLKGAEDLAPCKMSIAIEAGLRHSLEAAYRTRAKELGIEYDKVEKASGLTVRVVSNVEKKHFVGSEVSMPRFVSRMYPCSCT